MNLHDARAAQVGGARCGGGAAGVYLVIAEGGFIERSLRFLGVRVGRLQPECVVWRCLGPKYIRTSGNLQ